MQTQHTVQQTHTHTSGLSNGKVLAVSSFLIIHADFEESFRVQPQEDGSLFVLENAPHRSRGGCSVALNILRGAWINIQLIWDVPLRTLSVTLSRNNLCKVRDAWDERRSAFKGQKKRRGGASAGRICVPRRSGARPGQGSQRGGREQMSVIDGGRPNGELLGLSFCKLVRTDAITLTADTRPSITLTDSSYSLHV